MHVGTHAMNMQVEDRKQLAETGSLLLCGRQSRGSSGCHLSSHKGVFDGVELPAFLCCFAFKAIACG